MHSIAARLSFAALLLSCACSVHDEESSHRADSARSANDSLTTGAGTDDESAASPPSRNTVAGSRAAATTEGAPQSSVAVQYFTAAALNHVADSLARGSTTGHTLGAHGTFQYLQIRRATSGVPEIHDRWIDVTTVQAGHGTLLYGGKVRGGKLEPGGEHRGGVIEGGTTRPVGPGDLMVIPAGVPHQYQLAAGDSLRYLTVKVLSTPR